MDRFICGAYPEYQYVNSTFLYPKGNVCYTGLCLSLIHIYRPDIVYHAAAHKHVPLMEDSPNEAIKNNVFGTYKTAKAADKYGTSRFVLISTDKAVKISTKRLVPYLSAAFAVLYVPNTLFLMASFGLSSMRGTCLWAAAWYKMCIRDRHYTLPASPGSPWDSSFPVLGCTEIPAPRAPAGTWPPDR